MQTLTKKCRQRLPVGAALLTAWICLNTLASPARADSFDTWIANQTRASWSRLQANIHPPGTASGAVVASPSRSNPDYWFHWIRDAALVMDTVVTGYQTSHLQRDKMHYFQLLASYTDFSRANQLTPNPSGDPSDSGLGEPKFNVDGSAYNQPWGRPQNDGPALRAVTLIRFARQLIAEGRIELVRSKLYDGRLPAQTVIKADLEYVSHRWQQPGFDLWEEIAGDHFYTRMVQRRAMVDGARLAADLGDTGGAAWYSQQARALERVLMQHWNPQRGYMMATLHELPNDKGKVSGLDVAVLLGALHGNTGDGFLAPSHEMILATAEAVRRDFATRYDINRRDRDPDGQVMSTGIGRYPEDAYDGVGIKGKGNPWFLATHAYAELHYRIAKDYVRRRTIKITPLSARFLAPLAPGLGVRIGETISASDARFKQLIGAIVQAGDGFLRRSRFHVDTSGSMAEQFNRTSGFMQGARDLTWSYASFLTAIAQRPPGASSFYRAPPVRTRR